MTPSASTAGGRGDHGPRLSREDIIEAIRRWVALFGEPPVTADWNPSVARWRAQEWRIARYRAGDPQTGAPWPSLNAVKRRFGGSFADAVREAGFEPRRPGPPRAAHSARPAAVPRGDAPPTAAERLAAEVDALREALSAAEARAAAAVSGQAEAERRARAAERRIARAEERAREARLRARRAADRERRAKASRARAALRERAARTDAEALLRAITAEADARVARAADAAADAVAMANERAAAAEQRADAARADAERARALALRTTAADGRRHARRPVGHAATAPAGPGVLAEALTAVTRARTSGDRHGLQVALAALAAASVGWSDRL